MKAILFALIVCSVFADDLYNKNLHGKTILLRMRKIRSFNRRNERIYHRLERRERRLLNFLEVLYDDMKVAVGMTDRLKIEKQVEKIQKNLAKIRSQKRIIIRRMRRMADKIGAAERDRLVRMVRIEDKVGLDQNIHIRREIENNQKLILAETKALAHKYATLASEIAAAKYSEKVNKEKKGNLLNAEQEFKDVAKKTYNEVYKKIVHAIEDATSEGVANENIKLVCRNAIDGLIRKLEHEHLIYVVSRKEAKQEAKNVVKQPLKNAAKTLTKKFNDKTAIKDSTIKNGEKKVGGQTVKDQPKDKKQDAKKPEEKKPAPAPAPKK